MKKIIILASFLTIFLLCGCSSAANQVDVNMDLDIYEAVTEGNTLTFEYSEEINVEDAYEITSIEELTTGFGEFPYESVFVNKKEFSKYINGIEDYLTQISANPIADSITRVLGSKAKLIVTLSDGNSDIIIYFYQNDSNEIGGSAIAYVDYQNIDFIHYFRSEDGIVYTEINGMI